MNFHIVRGLSSRSQPLFFARSVRAVRQSTLVAVSALGMLYGGHAMAQDMYTGQVFLMGTDFCPKYSLPANGQLLGVQQNLALFALLGIRYGGDGQTTFGLPDLRGRSPIGMGQGPGLQNMSIGESGGAETAMLSQNNLPMHTHQITSTTSTAASTKPATHSTPATHRVPAQTMNAGGYIDASQADTELMAKAQSTASVAGASNPFPIRDPYLAMTWCIVENGIYPPRP